MLTMNPLEVAGVVTGILGVWLTTRQKIWCWPIGIASVVAYIVVFFQQRLYASMALQVVYVGLAAYGWYAWLHGGEDHHELRVSRTPSRLVLPLAAGVLAATAGVGWWLATRTDQALPYLDAFATVLSLVAQWMQTRKMLENWPVWIVVNVVYIGMVLSQGMPLTAGLYVIYAALAVIGFRDWRRSMADAVAA